MNFLRPFKEEKLRTWRREQGDWQLDEQEWVWKETAFPGRRSESLTPTLSVFSPYLNLSRGSWVMLELVRKLEQKDTQTLGEMLSALDICTPVAFVSPFDGFGQCSILLF